LGHAREIITLFLNLRGVDPARGSLGLFGLV
jgi:hypothetical protein